MYQPLEASYVIHIVPLGEHYRASALLYRALQRALENAPVAVLHLKKGCVQFVEAQQIVTAIGAGTKRHGKRLR